MTKISINGGVKRNSKKPAMVGQIEKCTREIRKASSSLEELVIGLGRYDGFLDINKNVKSLMIAVCDALPEEAVLDDIVNALLGIIAAQFCEGKGRELELQKVHRYLHKRTNQTINTIIKFRKGDDDKENKN